MSLAVKLFCHGKKFPIPRFKTFDQVSRVAEIIAEYMTICYTVEDLDGSNAFQEVYYEFLFLCGWTEERYNQEMLERIDQAW